jgi:hypothetical protein
MHVGDVNARRETSALLDRLVSLLLFRARGKAATNLHV